jgi:hypothetical protein
LAYLETKHQKSHHQSTCDSKPQVQWKRVAFV